MGEAARIWTTVGANIAPLKAGLVEAGAATEQFGRKFSGAMMNRTREMERFGRSVTRYISLPLAATGAVAAKMSIDFQRNMALVSTSAGASARDVAVLTLEVLKLAQSGRSPYGPNELAKALYHLKSLGYDNVTSMRTLRVAIDGALAGQSDLESTTSALGAAIRTNIKGTGDFRAAMATLNATVGAGNMRMEDLIAALGTGVLPTAKSAGLSLKDVGAALALMVDEGMSAESAATRLRMAFTMMAGGSQAANKALERIGLSTNKLGIVMQGPGGFIAGLKVLKSHLDQLGGSTQLAKWAQQVAHGKMSMEQFQKLAAKTAQFDVISRAFGGARSGAAIALLLNNLDVLDQKFAQIGRTAGDFKSKVKEARDLDVTKLKESWAQIDASLIKAGAEITPFVVKAARGLAGLATWFSNLSHGSRRFLLVAASALIVGGPILAFVAKMITGLRTVRSLFVAEAVASTAATATVETNAAAQAAAIDTAAVAAGGLRASLLRIANMGPIAVAIALAVVPKSSKGQKELDRAGVGFLGRLPLVGHAEQQVARAGAGAGAAFDHLVGVSSPDEVSAQKQRLWVTLVKRALKSGEGLHELQAGLHAVGVPGITSAKFKELQRERMNMQRGPGSVHAALAGAVMTHHPAGGTSGGGDTPAAKIKNFAVPYGLQLAQARAALTRGQGDDRKAARAVVAEAKRQIDSGRLSHKALLQAIDEEGAALSSLWSDQAKTAAKAKAKAKRQAKRAAVFNLPMALQVSQARADAIAALDPDAEGPTSVQISLARKAKQAAMTAIRSHHLTMSALIQAWQIVSQANSTLAQKLSGDGNGYTAVSSSAMTRGLHLSRDAAVQIQERYAQATAHGGSRPVGPAAEGIVIHNLHLHDVHDANKLFSELEKVRRKRGGQRIGQR